MICTDDTFFFPILCFILNFNKTALVARRRRRGRWENIRIVLKKEKKRAYVFWSISGRDCTRYWLPVYCLDIEQPTEDKSKSVYLSSPFLPSANKSARRLMQQVDILFAAKLLFLSRYNEVSPQNPLIILQKNDEINKSNNLDDF